MIRINLEDLDGPTSDCQPNSSYVKPSQDEFAIHKEKNDKREHNQGEEL
jgi:hypothetical protein